MATYTRLAALPLTVDGYRLEGRSRTVGRGFERRTTLVRLSGAGESGVGEDVTYEAGDQVRFQQDGDAFALAGRYALEEFAARLDTLDLFGGRTPENPASPDYRRWAFESAALDLALRQNGQSLAGALERQPRPVRFIVSLGLGSPPTLAPLERLRRRSSGVRFKLDASGEWTAALMRDLAGLEAVDVVDLKGAYSGTPVDGAIDPVLYGNVARLLPGCWIEDPAWTPETRAALAGHEGRVTWDAPIHSVEDLRKLEREPRMLNVKPSRLGTLARLCELYDYCGRRGIGMYGGGQFELGPGRGQIQLLAALFHADAPNDVAPTVFHGGAEGPLPRSPLQPRPAPRGFAWEEDA